MGASRAWSLDDEIADPRERVTTVFPKQGHYAFDPDILAEYPPADIELAKIDDLLSCDLAVFLKKY